MAVQVNPTPLLILAVFCGCDAQCHRDAALPNATGSKSEEIWVPNGPSRFPFCAEEGKWGFLNRRGEVVIEPRYLNTRDFHEGLALVWSNDGRRSFIDETGAVAFQLPSEWSRIHSSFSEGRVAFSIGESETDAEKWGFCDRRGKIVIEPKYDNVRDFQGGLACVNVGAKYREDPFPYPEQDGGKWGYVDRSGREIVAPAFSIASDFSEGIASVRTDEAELYIDDSGKTVSRFPRKITDGDEDAIFGRWPFKEGLAGAHLRRPKGAHRIGFLDKTGEFAIAPRFLWANAFSEGFAAVRDEGGGWGLIDRTGQYVVAPTFERTRSFCDGRAAVKLGDHWGYVNTKGVFVVKPGAAPRGGEGPINEVRNFRGGLARVHIGGECVPACDGPSEYEGGAWYYINREGEVVHRYCTDAQKGH